MIHRPVWKQPNQHRPLLMTAIALLILFASILYRTGDQWLRDQGGSVKPASASAATISASEAQTQQFEMRIQQNPNNAVYYAGLGLSLLQQVRESGDSTLYARAGQALNRAIELDPRNAEALLGQGMLAAAMHEFRNALDWADKAWSVNPYKAETLGVKVDALIELGRYDEAVTVLQQMVDLRPDLGSYSRISYLRELYGDVDGAIEAMRMAVESAPIGTESWLWTLTHLGNLHFNKGDLKSSAQIYEQVLQVRSNYSYALAGKARILGAEQHFEAAIALLTPVAERLPLPEFLTLLGELYEANGDPQSANEQYQLVVVIQQLNASAGMNVDLEMALFNANHGEKPLATVEEARAAYQSRPTIYGADALAWALYKAGRFDEAKQFSEESRKLGAQDAMLYFHAGMIEAALGNSANAGQLLQQALQINPHFSLLDVQLAKKTLEN